MTRIATNFNLEEFEVTNTGLPNKIPEGSEIYKNIVNLAELLQQLRDYLTTKLNTDTKISISSGYRCKEVNSHPTVRGALNSTHMYGLAADIKVAYMSPYQLATHIISSGIPFNKIIQEPSWVHIEVAPIGHLPNLKILHAVKNEHGDFSYPTGLLKPVEV